MLLATLHHFPHWEKEDLFLHLQALRAPTVYQCPTFLSGLLGTQVTEQLRQCPTGSWVTLSSQHPLSLLHFTGVTPQWRMAVCRWKLGGVAFLSSLTDFNPSKLPGRVAERRRDSLWCLYRLSPPQPQQWGVAALVWESTSEGDLCEHLCHLASL